MKNLVVATVGDSSLHKNWISGDPNFDLFLIYFGNNKGIYSNDSKYYIEETGFKFPLLYKHLSFTIRNTYDNFFLPDDDILMTTDDINSLFEQMKTNDYYVAQPSLQKNSHYTWPHTATIPDSISRNTHFVEIMCPIFTIDALNRFLPYFNETHTGWGLDRLWSEQAIKQGKSLGIFDNVSVFHNRKMGNGDLYINLKKEGIDYIKEYNDFLKNHHLIHISQMEKKAKW